MTAAGVASLWLLGALALGPAAAQQPDQDWPAEKCRRYTLAWDEARSRIGVEGLGADFLARHDAFIASECTGPHDVCPRTPAELAMADVMIIAAMNAGMASTFPPFGCG